jgi:hypothetical protein
MSTTITKENLHVLKQDYYKVTAHTAESDMGAFFSWIQCKQLEEMKTVLDGLRTDVEEIKIVQAG